MTDLKVSTVLGEILSGMAHELSRGRGPVKWCKRCSRKHPTRAGCGLTKVHVPASSGRMVERMVNGTGAGRGEG